MLARLTQRQSLPLSVKRLMMEENQYSFRARAQQMEAEQIIQHAEWYFQQIPVLEANGIDWLVKQYRWRAQLLMSEAENKKVTAEKMSNLAAQYYEQALQEKKIHEAKQMKKLEEGLLGSTLLEEEEEEIVQPTEPWYNRAMECIDPSQVLEEPMDLMSQEGQDTIKIEEIEPEATIGITKHPKGQPGTEIDQEGQQGATIGITKHPMGQPRTETDQEGQQETTIEITTHPIGQQDVGITKHLICQQENKIWAPRPEWNMVVFQNVITDWMKEGATFPSKILITETPPTTPTEDLESRSDASIVDLQDTSRGNVQ